MGRLVRWYTLNPRKTVYMPRTCFGIGECCLDVVQYVALDASLLQSLVKLFVRISDYRICVAAFFA